MSINSRTTDPGAAERSECLSPDILVLQNDEHGDVGHFGATLTAKGARLTVLRADLGNKLSQEEAAHFKGLVVLGGRASAFDDESFPFLPGVLDLIAAFQSTERPIFGICLGAQLLARANGSSFASNNGWEVGFVPLEPTADGRQDPVFGTVPTGARFLELHEDQFCLPEGAVLMMTGAACRNQAFRVGLSSYGIQFHPEVTEEAIHAMAAGLEGVIDEAGRALAARMLDYAPDDFKRQEGLCEELAVRWLRLVRTRAEVAAPA